MEQEEYQSSNQSKFNSANDILQTIGYLKFKTTEAYRKGDLEAWYYEWKQVRFQTVGRMTDEEYNDFVNLEKRISFVLNNINRNSGYKKLMIQLIELYVRKIQVKIEEWGMGLVNKSDETRFA